MAALQVRGIPFRNEQQMQDLATEPAAKLIVDFLSCLYGTKKSKAWCRLAEQMETFVAEEEMAGRQHRFQSFLRDKRRDRHREVPFSERQNFVSEFLDELGSDVLAGLSHDYENGNRLEEVIRDTQQRIDELVAREPDLPTALDGFADDNAVRILTMHKSKGLVNRPGFGVELLV
jgi:ATP-dependent exoDNAse (exonuclease V) beta subunit